MTPNEFTILTPNGMLGYGYRKEHFWYGIEKYKPSAIILDCGSTDGGPYKLGLKQMTCGRGSYIRDLEPILDAAYHRKIKVLIGSVGGDGSDWHVQEMLDIVTSLAKSKGYSFKIATINAGFDRNLIAARLASRQVSPCGPVPPLTEEDITTAVDVVAQMGCEPYLEALQHDPDIILGGRSYDPAPFAAFCLSKGCEPGIAWHMGKIMECGGMCAVPKGRSMIATMRADSFDLTPLSPEEQCTPLSVAAHTLYEKSRPDRLPGPGGVLELDSARYEQITPKTTRIRGARFVPSPVYQVKLEGVKALGYRSIFIGGIRDPTLINQIDDFLERVRTYTRGLFPQLDQSEECRLIYHIYGRDAVMGQLEVEREPHHEIGILGEVVAPTKDLAYTIANNARASILHFPYPNQVATTGNFASPLSPHEQDAGAVFKFSLYHLVDLREGEESSLFPISLHEITSDSTPALLESLSDAEFATLEKGKLKPITQKQIPEGRAKMSEIARIIRSKNSGPFELTLDIMFDSKAAFDRVKSINVLTNTTIKRLYGVSDDDILTNMYFEPALGWKCTIKRPWAQGSVGERDTLGTQQHAPLLNVEVPPALTTDHPSSIESNGNTSNGHVNGHVNGANGLHGKDAMHDRSGHSTLDTIREICILLQLPSEDLAQMQLAGADSLGLPSSYKIGHLAQASIAVAAQAAASVASRRNPAASFPRISVPLRHACAEFKSERLYVLDGQRNENAWGPIGGLHQTSDGWVRIHDSFQSHRDGAVKLVGLNPKVASREDVAEKTAHWTSIDLENEAVANDLVIGALRTYRQWDTLPQSRAVSNQPVIFKKVRSGDYKLERINSNSTKCLAGLRVVEMSRVIAAPCAGRTLAAHGADVIWVTSPNLSDLPAMDRDLARGKRTVHLDIKQSQEDKQKLLELIKSADVFIQGYRPGSLEALGLGTSALLDVNPGLIIANLSAYGPHGPWACRRGFDSIVQTVSGMNVSEAEHNGKGESARPMPCQALDHSAGYLLATGIMAAVYRKMEEGGAYEVHVSLSGMMKFLRSLGQYDGHSGFDCEDIVSPDQISDLMETRTSGFGELTAVRHSASIEGYKIGWDIMPKPLGSDEPLWLQQ